MLKVFTTDGSFFKKRYELLDGISGLLSSAQAEILIGFFKDTFSSLTSATLANLLTANDYENCGYLQIGHVDSLAMATPTRYTLTPACASKALAIWTVKMLHPSRIPFLGDNFFALAPLNEANIKIHSSWFSGMSTKQAANYHKGHDKGSTICDNLSIADMSDDGRAGVTPACFYSLAANKGSVSFGGDDAAKSVWMALSENIFAEFVKAASGKSPSLEAVEHVGANLKNATTKQLSQLLGAEASCAKIPAKVLPEHPAAVVSAACFGKFIAAVQSEALEHLNVVPKELFKHTKDADIANWTVTRGETEFKKLAAVMAIKDDSLVAEVFSHIDDNPKHPCSSKTLDAEVLEKAPALQKLVTAQCVEKAGLKVDTEKWPDLVGKQAWEPIKALLDKKAVDEPTFVRLVEGRVFCKKATGLQINGLPSALMARMDAACAALLPDLTNVDAEHLNAMSPAAFSLIDGAKAAQLKLDGLGDACFAELSSAVADSAQSYAATVTKGMLGAWSESRVKALSARFWEQIPAEAFSEMKEAQFRAWPAERMVGVTLSQAKSIPVPILKLIAAKQMAKIGLNHHKTPNSPLSLFEPLVDELDPEARKVFHHRNSASTLAATLTVGSVVVGLLLALW